NRKSMLHASEVNQIPESREPKNVFRPTIPTDLRIRRARDPDRLLCAAGERASLPCRDRSARLGWWIPGGRGTGAIAGSAGLRRLHPALFRAHGYGVGVGSRNDSSPCACVDEDRMGRGQLRLAPAARESRAPRTARLLAGRVLV